MMGELFRLMNETGQGLDQVRVAPADLAALAGLVAAGRINTNTAKGVFEAMFRSGRPPADIVAEQGLAQVSDTAEIERLVAEVLAAHPNELATYLGGKATVEAWFFGQVMRRLRGQGNPQVIRTALARALEKIKRGA
jgi:aspartyl-tRNA(Asn)/glutamyl-tRNA(Gln) amidotransferase subunit B